MGENGSKSSKSSVRDQRLKAALRENLRRRKARERARGAASAPETRTKPMPPSQEEENR